MVFSSVAELLKSTVCARKRKPLTNRHSACLNKIINLLGFFFCVILKFLFELASCLVVAVFTGLPHSYVEIAIIFVLFLTAFSSFVLSVHNCYLFRSLN